MDNIEEEEDKQIEVVMKGDEESLLEKEDEKVKIDEAIENLML